MAAAGESKASAARPEGSGVPTWASECSTSEAFTCTPMSQTSDESWAGDQQQKQHRHRQLQLLQLQQKKRQSCEHLRTLTEETSSTFGVPGLRFEIKEALGEGGFGTVHRCCRAAAADRAADGGENREYAVKVLDARRLSILLGAPLDLVCPRLRREVEILSLLGAEHDGILRLHYAFFSESTHKFFLVTDLLSGGDLFSAIVKRGKPFGEAQAAAIFGQLVDAVAYCHSKGVAHRDLKLENCLFENAKSLRVRVCDYGQAKLLREGGVASDTAQTLTTTPCYTAPEVAAAVKAGQPYDAFKADSFALGVVLYALLCNALPDPAKGAAYQRNRQWAKLSENARGLVTSLLDGDPALRPLPEDLKSHAWLQQGASEPTLPSRRPPTAATAAAAEPKREPRSAPSAEKALLAVQAVVSALQKELGLAGWALSAGEKTKLEAQRNHLNECLDRACAQIIETVSSGSCDMSVWEPLCTVLCGLKAELQRVRTLCDSKLDRGDDADVSDEDSNEVGSSYFDLQSKLVEVACHLLPQLSCHGKRNSARSAVLRLHFLQLASGHLAHERGLVACLLGQRSAGALARDGVAREVAEVVGARKMMLGAAQARLEFVGSGSGGLATMLGLGSASSPLLGVADLAAIEALEDRVLSLEGLEAPTVEEWWNEFTKAVDAVQHQITLDISEYFQTFGRAVPT